MGSALVRRLLAAGFDVTAQNRTRAKAEALIPLGARVVDGPADLADRQTVFTCVDVPASLLSVTDSLFAATSQPGMLVDCSTVDADTGHELRGRAADAGWAVLAAPVSGNAGAVDAGAATLVVSGPADAYRDATPLLAALGRAVTYVGDGEAARTLKLAHNLFLGVVSQALAETAVLAEASGVPRGALLEFINNSVLGSEFSKYKTHALTELDFTPTFTTRLLRKDFDLGLAQARRHEVPMPVTTATYQRVQEAVGAGHGDVDFAALLLEVARGAGVELVPEREES
jgi:3-hydroxyisobutyrate dehydrogenase-like beta-hydroxyacid dehydrogenase